MGGLGRHPGHGENGALGGLHHGLVGRLHAQGQGLGQMLAVDLLAALKTFCDTPEEQRKDDARIAPGAPQQGGGRRFGNRLGRLVL